MLRSISTNLPGIMPGRDYGQFTYVRLHRPESGKYREVTALQRAAIVTVDPTDRILGERTHGDLLLLRQRSGWIRCHQRFAVEGYGVWTQCQTRRVSGRRQPPRPFPCATPPEDTSCRAIRSRHSIV